MKGYVWFEDSTWLTNRSQASKSKVQSARATLGSSFVSSASLAISVAPRLHSRHVALVKIMNTLSLSYICSSSTCSLKFGPLPTSITSPGSCGIGSSSFCSFSIPSAYCSSCSAFSSWALQYRKINAWRIMKRYVVFILYLVYKLYQI